MKEYIRKLIRFIILYPVYYFIWFSILNKEILENELVVFTILLYLAITLIDFLLRPVTDPEELKDKYTIILIMFFLAGPLIFLLAFYENKIFVSQYLMVYDNELTTYLGYIVIIVGGLVLLSSRYQLNKITYGGGSLSGEQEQNLVQTGMYRMVRHPIYTGGLIITIGLNLAFRSLLILIIHTLIYLIIFIDRMNKEEEDLKRKFGDDYTNYCRKTKRIIPYIY